MDGFVERMEAVEVEMRKLTDIAVTLARYDERMLSRTKSTFMYAAGHGPLMFTAPVPLV